MNNDIQQYIQSSDDDWQTICHKLASIINGELPQATSKVWHGHPVWFLDGNPTVGFSIQKPGVRLMFWSGADFDEPELKPRTGKFKDASIFYATVDQINETDLQRWLEKSQNIQRDYKNLIQRKGHLERIV